MVGILIEVGQDITVVREGRQVWVEGESWKAHDLLGEVSPMGIKRR